MVWFRARSQHSGDGLARSFSRGPLQLLLASVHHQDSSHVSRWVQVQLLVQYSGNKLKSSFKSNIFDSGQDYFAT